MTETKALMRQTLQIIIKEIKEMNKQIKKELKEDAPKTTKIKPIYFGNPRVIPDQYEFGENLGYEEYLGTLLTSYIEYKRGCEIKSPYKNYLESSHPLTGDKFNFDWEETRKGHGGILWNNEFIFIEALPHSEVRKIENKLQSELPETSLKEDLVKFIRDFNLRLHSENADYRNVNYRTLKHIISHELTHDYIKNKSKIGQLRDYAESDEVWANTDLERMLLPDDKGEIIPVQSQVKQISKNTLLLTIEEMFAFFVANHYVKTGAPRKPKAFKAYDKPREIAWGIQILEEKSNEVEGSVVDWAREKSVEIFSYIAEVGQVKDPSGRRKPETIFLRMTLPDTEKERLEQFKKICEQDLTVAFKNFQKALTELAEESNPHLQEIRALEQEIDWKNPSHIEDIVNHQTAEKAAEEMFSLGKTVELFQKNIEKEIEKLRTYIKYGEKLENKLKPTKSENLEEALYELEEADKKLKSLV